MTNKTNDHVLLYYYDHEANAYILYTRLFVIVSNKTNDHATAILVITEGQFQVFQRFSSYKLVLKTVESCLAALNYHENGSSAHFLDAKLYRSSASRGSSFTTGVETDSRTRKAGYCDKFIILYKSLISLHV